MSLFGQSPFEVAEKFNTDVHFRTGFREVNLDGSFSDEIECLNLLVRKRFNGQFFTVHPRGATFKVEFDSKGRAQVLVNSYEIRSYKPYKHGGGRIYR